MATREKVSDVARIIALCTLFVCMGTSTGASIGKKNATEGLVGTKYLDAFCLTPACVHTTSEIMRSMNPSVKPCDDFYEFACGHYDENTRIPHQFSAVSPTLTAEQKVLSRLQSLIEKIDAKTAPVHFRSVKRNYENCLHRRTSSWQDPVTTFQNAIYPVMVVGNRFPFLYPSDWNETTFDYAATFFSLFRFAYRKNVTTKFTVPELFLRNPLIERHHLKEGFSNYLVQGYFQYMQNIIRIIMGTLTDDAKNNLIEILSTEIELFRDVFIDDIETDLYRRYHKANLVELNQKYKHLKFPLSLKNYPGTKIQMTIDMKTLDKLDQWIATKSKKTLANWEAWRAVVPSLATLTSQTIHQTSISNFYRTGVTGEENISKSCVKATQNGQGFALGALYQRKYIKECSVDEMIVMLNTIKEEMTRFVNEAQWLNAKTKPKALEKVTKMANSLALCRDLITDDELAAHTAHSATIVTPGAIPNTTNRAMCGRFFQQTQYLTNFLQFALSLYTEFYHVTQPKYLNYGALGMRMGREISKSLGVNGRYYDIEGNIKPWWDPQSDEMYKTRSKCFVDKYGNYKLDDLDIAINGTNTLAEHVADHTGLKAAYNAYTKLLNAGLSEKPLHGLEYSPKQLFWINMAVSQCSSYRPEFLKSQIIEGNSVWKFRVNSAVSNLEGFSNDFGCAAGTKMNPVEKCNLW